MVCPKCKATVPGDSAFCQVCGSDVRATATIGHGTLRNDPFSTLGDLDQDTNANSDSCNWDRFRYSKKFSAQYHPLRQMRVGLMLAILQITTVRIKKQQHIIIDLVLLATMYSAQDMTNLEMNMSSLQTKPSRHVVLK